MPRYKPTALLTLPSRPQSALQPVGLLNTRNLKMKSSRFPDYISDHHPDIVAVTETWFTSRDAAVKVGCTPPGYKLLDRARSAHRQGGGTTLICRDSFTVKCNASGEVSSFEFSDWTFSSSQISLRIILIYRPPYSTKHLASISTFLNSSHPSSNPSFYARALSNNWRLQHPC